MTTAANKAKASKDAMKLFNDAKPTIEKMVALAACGADGRQMAKFADPEKGYGYASLFIFLAYRTK